MDKRLLATAIAAILTSGVPALALDNESFGFQCDCLCTTPSGSFFTTYRDLGLGCAVLNNRTCNVENPATGLIETGRTETCSPGHEPLDTGFQQLDPGNTPTVTQPGQVAPLPGAVRR